MSNIAPDCVQYVDVYPDVLLTTCDYEQREGIGRLVGGLYPAGCIEGGSSTRVVFGRIAMGVIDGCSDGGRAAELTNEGRLDDVADIDDVIADAMAHAALERELLKYKMVKALLVS